MQHFRIKKSSLNNVCIASKPFIRVNHTHGRQVHVQASLVQVTSASVHVGSGTGRKCILDDVNFSVQAGELHMLVGPNGCGKVRPRQMPAL